MIICLLAVFPALVASGQGRPSAREEIGQDIRKAAGVFYLYDFSRDATIKPPRGYKPFYVSHYGRHGARRHSTEADLVAVDSVFEQAHLAGNLTEKGERFRAAFKELYAQSRYHAGDLTEKGREQHKEIARRMFHNFPQVFKGRPVIDARATLSTRCILSMASFCNELIALSPSARVHEESSYSDMGRLSVFHPMQPQFLDFDDGLSKKGPWYKDYSKFFNSLDHKTFLKKYFKDVSGISREANLTRQMYYMFCSGPCLDTPVYFWDVIDEDDAFNYWEAFNFRFYSAMASWPANKGRKPALAWILLDDIVSRADEDLATGGTQARLRFGHDIVLMSFLDLMGAEGWDRVVTDPHKAKEVFRSYDVPMASNIQFAFYRGRKGDVIVRVLYNGNDLPLPVEKADVSGGKALGLFYEWPVLRAYFIDRIASAKALLASTGSR